MLPPVFIQNKISTITSSSKASRLLTHRELLTENYKIVSRNVDPITHTEDFHTYLLSRFPATYSVCHKVLSMLGQYSIKSMLDVGAGPGTAIYAALEIFKDLTHITAVERNKFFLEFMKENIETVSRKKKLSFQMENTEIRKYRFTEKTDLAVLSYVINELEESAKEQLIVNTWNNVDNFLVLIEPGTPRGFENIKKARETLLSRGAYTVAPCTHATACPMNTDSWCHFYERFPRSKQQQYLKAASTGYEDEKYSYIIFSKQPVEYVKGEGRIVRFPKIMKGHVKLEVCTEEGIELPTVSASKGNYREVKKKDWGDIYTA